jgi:DNA-binding transcriptional LysR family regulator
MSFDKVGDLLYFVTVVEEQGFTAAAKRLNTTKSAVSKRVARLEQSLGVQLLQRNTRRFSLTESGNELFVRGKSIRDDLDETEQVVTSKQFSPKGTLRVSSPMSFGQLHLNYAIRDFLVEHDEINVELFLGRNDTDIIESGVDVAIHIGKLPDSGLIARKLTQRRMRLVGSPEYFEKHGKPKCPEDLEKHNCLLYRNSPTGNYWYFQDDEDEIRMRVTGNFISNSAQALEDSAVNGLGLIYLPGYMLTSDIKKGVLVPVLEEYCDISIDVFVVFAQSHYLPPKIRLFVDYVVTHFSNPEYWGE